MPSIEQTAQTFFSEILPKASSTSAWDPKKAGRAFRWAQLCTKLCEDVPDTTLKSKMAKAPLLLVEEFLRNSQLQDQTFLVVLQAAGEVFGPDRLSQILQTCLDRKSAYSDAIQLVQQQSDSTDIKAAILLQDLLKVFFLFVLNGRPIFNVFLLRWQEDARKLDSRIQSLLDSVATVELLLTVVTLPVTTDQEAELGARIRTNVEATLTDWLDFGIRSNVVAALLAVPVRLTRRMGLRVWLDCLADLAGRLEPDRYGSFAWPECSEDETKYRGIRFSLNQLGRHFDRNGQDNSSVDEFLSARVQSAAPGCSVWFQLQQNTKT